MTKLADEMKKLSREFAENSITDNYKETINKIRKVATTTGRRHLVIEDVINTFERDKLEIEDGFKITKMSGGELLFGELIRRGDLLIEW